jgi:DNA gyrase/topoisomerase IV subunit B
MIDEKLFLLEDIDIIKEIGKCNMVDIQVLEDESFVLSNGIVSHNSAKSMIGSVRDPEIHGSLPLRGKIMNVRGESNKDIIGNQIIADIMQSLGIQIGVKAIRKDLRYGKVYLSADQDPDGANITALLVNFFYLQWPELFDPNQDPFFYVFQTPFIIQEYGKGKRKYWYASDYHEYNPDDWKGYPHATRAKGLGSLEEVDWVYSLANPKLVPLLDDGKLAEALELIFDSRLSDQRKIWISL